MISSDAHMMLEFDEYSEWNAFSTGSTPQVIQVDKGVFTVKDIANYSNDQYQKIIWMFNLYQHFRFESVSVEWIPRYNNQVTPAQYAAFRQQLITQGSGIDQRAQTLIGLADNGWVTMVEDWDDTIIRSNLDEYWQAVSLPKAVTGSWHSQFKKQFHPHTLDVVQTYTDSVGQIPGGNNATESTSPTVQNLQRSAGDVPMPCPWFATHVVNDSSGQGTVTLNMGQAFNGYKIYLYTPFNDPVTNTGAADEVAGLKRFKYHVSFKDRDTRALTSIVTLAGEHELYQKSMANIIRKRGLRGIMYDSKQPSLRPSITEEKTNADMMELGLSVPPKKHKGPVEEFKDEVTAAAAGPARASQGTQLSRPRPGPVGLSRKE